MILLATYSWNHFQKTKFNLPFGSVSLQAYWFAARTIVLLVDMYSLRDLDTPTSSFYRKPFQFKDGHA